MPHLCAHCTPRWALSRCSLGSNTCPWLPLVLPFRGPGLSRDFSAQPREGHPGVSLESSPQLTLPLELEFPEVFPTDVPLEGEPSSLEPRGDLVGGQEGKAQGD